MSGDAWAELPAFIASNGGYDRWDVNRLVLWGGSQKAGARIVQRIEQELAKHNIGHLPPKLPTDSTCRVILYNKDRLGLGTILQLVHELAAGETDDGTNTRVLQLEAMLDFYKSATTPPKEA